MYIGLLFKALNNVYLDLWIYFSMGAPYNSQMDGPADLDVFFMFWVNTTHEIKYGKSLYGPFSRSAWERIYCEGSGKTGVSLLPSGNVTHHDMMSIKPSPPGAP